MSGMMYMFVTQAPGEEPVDTDNHWNLVRITGYEHSLVNEVTTMRPSAGANVGLRRGQTRHGNFVVHKELDKSSTMLFRFAEMSVVIPRVSLFLCQTTMANAAATLEPFLTLELTNSVIASFEHGSKGGWPTETLRFHYTSFNWALDWRARADDADLGTIVNQWDGTKNTLGSNAPKTPADGN